MPVDNDFTAIELDAPAPRPKVRPVKIVFTRVEGPLPSTTIEGAGDLWARANSYISMCRAVAPNDGSYHKTDFAVTFENGEVYTGRIDIQGYERPFEGLQEHIRRHLAFHAGVWCPAHLTLDEYRGCLAACGLGESAARWKYIHMLTTYDLDFDAASARLLV